MPEEDLEPLITECPSCHTRFRVWDAQLKRARGRVRCGACLAVFHGIDHLVADSLPGHDDSSPGEQALDDLLDELAAERGGVAAPPPEEAPRAPRAHAGREEPPAASPAISPATSAATSPESEPVFQVLEPPVAGEPDGGHEAPESAEVPAEDAPAVAPDRETPAAHVAEPVVFGEPRQWRPLVALGIAAGLALLVAQVLVYQFDDWAKREPWRSVYAPICRVLGCDLPVQRDLGRLTTRNLLVRSHPSQPKALLVSAVIVNRAEFAQPFPALVLQFTSLRGNLVASRRFEPDEYLAGDARGMTLMPPRTPVQIELTMEDPGPDAVNYRLDFR